MGGAPAPAKVWIRLLEIRSWRLVRQHTQAARSTRPQSPRLGSSRDLTVTHARAWHLGSCRHPHRAFQTAGRIIATRRRPPRSIRGHVQVKVTCAGFAIEHEACGDASLWGDPVPKVLQPHCQASLVISRGDPRDPPAAKHCQAHHVPAGARHRIGRQAGAQSPDGVTAPPLAWLPCIDGSTLYKYVPRHPATVEERAAKRIRLRCHRSSSCTSRVQTPLPPTMR